MSSNGARSGGGGSGVPDMIRPAKIRRKEIIKEKISKLPSLSIIRAAGEPVGKFTKEQNLKRRKEFIKSKGLTSEEINMSDSYLSSAAGLAELRKQGYRTVVDTSKDGGGNDNRPAQVKMANLTAPTTAEVSQSAATEAASPEEDILYRKRKTKRQGKSLTIQTSPTGVTAGLTLGKRSLLGTA